MTPPHRRPRNTVKPLCVAAPVGHVFLLDTASEAKSYSACLRSIGRKSSQRMAVLHDPSEGIKVEVLS